jgi:hypothetical protein
MILSVMSLPGTNALWTGEIISSRKYFSSVVPLVLCVTPRGDVYTLFTPHVVCCFSSPLLVHSPSTIHSTSLVLLQVVVRWHMCFSWYVFYGDFPFFSQCWKGCVLCTYGVFYESKCWWYASAYIFPNMVLSAFLCVLDLIDSMATEETIANDLFK